MPAESPLHPPSQYKSTACQHGRHTRRPGLLRPKTHKRLEHRSIMKVSCIASSLLVSALLSCLWGTAMGWRLHLGSCTVSVHTHELRHYFQEIRHSAVTGDSHLGVRLLKKDVMKNVQAKESCCFLRHLLRFYVERVFSSYAASESQHRRTTSVLANSFLSIKRDLRQCHAQMHCHCGEDTKVKLDAIQANFEKLDVKAAAVKAVSELDSLLEWLEGFIAPP